jgi:hypothetical protein
MIDRPLHEQGRELWGTNRGDRLVLGAGMLGEARLRSPLVGLGGETSGRRTAHRSRRSIPPRSAFAGFGFPSAVIVLAVRWYLRFGLS